MRCATAALTSVMLCPQRATGGAAIGTLALAVRPCTVAVTLSQAAEGRDVTAAATGAGLYSRQQSAQSSAASTALGVMRRVGMATGAVRRAECRTDRAGESKCSGAPES